MPSEGTSKVDDIIEALASHKEQWARDAARLIPNAGIPAETLAVLLTNAGHPISASSIRTWRRIKALEQSLKEDA